MMLQPTFSSLRPQLRIRCRESAMSKGKSSLSWMEPLKPMIPCSGALSSRLTMTMKLTLFCSIS